MAHPPITITAYERRYHRELMRLVEEQYRVHLHLDWTTLDEWIHEPRTVIRLAWDGDILVGALSVSPPIERSAWLRLAVIHDDADPQTIFGMLWPTVREQAAVNGAREVGVLLLRPWLGTFLPQLGFAKYENVVTLARNGGPVPKPLRNDLTIHHGTLADLDRVVSVDHAAFGPLWRMSPASLRQAIRDANSFTLALQGRQLRGYQVSMRYSDGGHLARLATVPEAQGTGIGGALLTEMLEGYARRGLHYLTVNTQETNRQSLSLYRRYGFNPTGLDYPVWRTTLV